MRYKKSIKTTFSEYIIEHIINQEIYLKDYLTMSKEMKMQYLPHEYSEFFDDFLIETQTDFEMPKESKSSGNENEEVEMFDNNIELIIWLETNDEKTYNSFAEYLYEKITDNTLPIPDSEYPAWSYFSDNPEIIKNQWLIHFTENANYIAKDGFKYGADDMNKLGLTTQLSDYDKKYGGYNFAYTISDFKKYASGKYGDYNYGNEAVLFKASGIKVWHYGDEEPQVIFYGNTATDIIPITDGHNSKYAIFSNDGNLLYEDDNLDKVVHWTINNFSQYRKKLIRN